MIGLLPDEWKYRLILPLSAFMVISVIDMIALQGGFSLRITDPSPFELITSFLNFFGIFAAFMFGDLLAHRDDPVHTWNLFLFFAGGVGSWTLLCGIIGYYIDYLRSSRK